MSNATTQVERHFQMHSVYKRSKQYFDIQKMKEQQHLQEVYRRKPNYSIETLDTRVDQSFVNATQVVNRRLDQDINDFKKRYQDDADVYTNADTSRNQLDTEDDYDGNLRSSRNRIKGPDLMKMPGRKAFGQTKIIYNNEAQFNNFSLVSPRSKAQLNFSLSSPRSKSSLADNPQTLKQSQDIGKAKQKNSFNSSVYKCLFDYSKINKYGKYSRKQKTQVKMPVIPHERIASAEKHAQTNPSPGINEFYLSIGKDTPSQMNFRISKQDQNYFGTLSQRRQSQDYTCQKRRQDMTEKRLHSILKRKQVKDNRHEMCDYKFFNRCGYKEQ